MQREQAPNISNGNGSRGEIPDLLKEKAQRYLESHKAITRHQARCERIADRTHESVGVIIAIPSMPLFAVRSLLRRRELTKVIEESGHEALLEDASLPEFAESVIESVVE